MTLFRPPKQLPPDTPSGLGAVLGKALTEIYGDLKALTQSAGDVSVATSSYRASAGETKRVSPPVAGMGFILPAPSPENRGSTISVFLEQPEGALRVFVAPNATNDATVNGTEMVSFTTEGLVVFESNGVNRWSAMTGVVGATGATGPTGPTGATGATGAASAAKRIRTEIYRADGSLETLDENGASVTTTSSTWSLQSDGYRYRVWLVPGGTGGARAPRTNTTGADFTGPSGSGGGAVGDLWFGRDELAAYIAAIGTPIPVTVGLAGAGASAGSAGSGNANGAQGTLGGVSAFGALLAAYPGGRGGTNTNNGSSAASGAGGGGWMSAGADGTVANQPGGSPNDVDSANTKDSDFGGGRGDTGAASTGASVYGGGGGGGNAAGSGTNGRPAGRSLQGVPGAGPGGSLDTTGPTARNGGDAGKRGFDTTGGTAPALITGGGPTGGAGVSGAGNGGNGGDGADGILGLYPGQSGAGGGALIATSGSTSSTGRGGDGGFPGGSGGSSGVGVVSGATAVTIARGGDGKNGVVVVFTYG